MSAMQADLGVAIRTRLRPDEGLDVIFYNGRGVSKEIVKTVKPFFVNG